jgi:hypothetical protein
MTQPSNPQPEPWVTTPATPADAPNQFLFGGPPLQPYATPPWPPAPQRRRKWVPWVITAAVLVVVGVGAAVAVIGVRASHAMTNAKGAVNGFLSAVEHGDAGSAQALLCSEAPHDAVQTSLASQITGHRIIGVYVQNSFSTGDSTSHENAQVTVDVTLAGHVTHRDVVDVELENGHWLVCGVTQKT